MSGCLAVYYSCVLQRIVAKLYHVNQIKDWLRLPSASIDTEESDTQVSLAAVFIVADPFVMVEVSIFSFLLGLAIYQGFIWTRSLDQLATVGDSRSVFIMFIVTSGACLAFFTLVFSTKFIENLLGAGRRDTGRLASRLVDISGASDGTTPNNDYGDPHELRNNQSSQPKVRAAMEAPSQAVNPGDPSKRGANQISNAADLVGVLQAAAESHAQCAEADRLIAANLAKLYSNE